MKMFIADAFTEKHFGGNPAGIALLKADEPFPSDDFMQQMAAELKHSETAFIHPEGGGTFSLRYFTPAGEVDLCGHATIAAFTVLKDEGLLESHESTALTKAGRLKIFTDDHLILMSMAKSADIRKFDLSSPEDAKAVDSFYQSFGLTKEAMPNDLLPQIVSTGLPDILLPVRDKSLLDTLKPDFDKITEISRSLNVVGFHVFSLGNKPDITADCRNFAPLYAINEEAATGTSNGALTWYLYEKGIIEPGMTNTFLQGEAMGRPSKIMSKVTEQGDILIGGNAVILFRGELE